MNIFSCILHIYPDLKPGKDFSVQDDGEGQYIATWDNDFQIPTTEEMQSAWVEVSSKPLPLTPIEELRKQQADLVFELMVKGVL